MSAAPTSTTPATPTAASADATSAEAAALIKLVPALEHGTLANVERLLLADIAAPARRELREARLGLLIALVSDRRGEVPQTDEYDERRADRVAEGETWPDSSTLGRAFGGWPMAVRAAMRLAYGEQPRRVHHTRRRRGSPPSYTRAEVVAALVRFRDEHDGRWPSATQFETWGNHLRRLAHEGGRPDPRIPSRGAWRKHFARFADAVSAAGLQA